MMGREFRFCPMCGHPLVTRHHEGRPRLLCDRCGFVFYQNPVMAAGVLLPRAPDEVLLLRRTIEPGLGKWTFPGGFSELGETPAETAVREAMEEVGVEVVLEELQGLYMGLHDVVVAVYRGRIVRGEPRPLQEADEVRFFRADELPEAAFKTTADALADWARSARNGRTGP